MCYTPMHDMPGIAILNFKICRGCIHSKLCYTKGIGMRIKKTFELFQITTRHCKSCLRYLKLQELVFPINCYKHFYCNSCIQNDHFEPNCDDCRKFRKGDEFNYNLPFLLLDPKINILVHDKCIISVFSIKQYMVSGIGSCARCKVIFSSLKYLLKNTNECKFYVNIEKQYETKSLDYRGHNQKREYENTIGSPYSNRANKQPIYSITESPESLFSISRPSESGRLALNQDFSQSIDINDPNYNKNNQYYNLTTQVENAELENQSNHVSLNYLNEIYQENFKLSVFESFCEKHQKKFKKIKCIHLGCIDCVQVEFEKVFYNFCVLIKNKDYINLNKTDFYIGCYERNCIAKYLYSIDNYYNKAVQIISEQGIYKDFILYARLKFDGCPANILLCPCSRSLYFNNQGCCHLCFSQT